MALKQPRGILSLWKLYNEPQGYTCAGPKCDVIIGGQAFGFAKAFETGALTSKWYCLDCIQAATRKADARRH